MEPGMQLNNLWTFLAGQLNICRFSTRDRRFPFAMSGIFGDIILLSLLNVVAVSLSIFYLFSSKAQPLMCPPLMGIQSIISEDLYNEII